jgi:thioredoxin reductase (NADPH)
MSRYLIRRIEESPQITLRTRTEILRLSGGTDLEAVQWRNGATGETEDRPIRHVFCMIGSKPLHQLARGMRGAGRQGVREDRPGPHSPGPGEHGLATLAPTAAARDFAAGHLRRGDVRSGNIKRVASAVGEGSISIQLVHRVLGLLTTLVVAPRHVTNGHAPSSL